MGWFASAARALVLSGVALVLASDEYSESLVLTPLKHNMLLSEFSFEMAQKVEFRPEGTQYSAFSRSLGQIIDRSQTHELHLRFGQGWWDAESFGVEPRNGTVSGGIGVEMWAWMHGATLEEARKNWHRLANSLSGYFCASLNFIDISHTSFPSESVYQPTGDSSEDLWLFRGALPAEPVCTENLTPFLKLLPCKGNAGIASLLDGHSLFDSQWQSMAVDVDHADGKLRLRQHISNVVDVNRMLQRRKTPLPRPIPYEEMKCDMDHPWANEYICYPKDALEANWRLSDLYGRTINGACPLAGKSSTITIHKSENWATELTRAVGEVEEIVAPEQPDVYLIETNAVHDLTLQTDNSTQIAHRSESHLFVDRSFTGWGQQSGGIRTVFTNRGSEPVEVTYFESFPWFMRLYLHTLKTEPADEDTIQHLDYRGANDRGRPSQLELRFTVPPRRHVMLEYKFDKSLLFIEEYPPDANHGFEIEPGIVVTADGYTTRTTSLLLALPVPDFSMPYNVIILTSTVMSLAFGNIMNTLTKTTVPERIAEQLNSQKPLGKLLRLFSRTKLKSE